MEITKREILFSVIIISIMVLIGAIISRPILTHSLNNALKITSSVQTKDSLAFDYIIRRNAGDFLAEGTIHAINRVSIEDIDGEYSRIIRKTQEYRKHTETYTTTDSKGNIQTHTRTYWSWNMPCWYPDCNGEIVQVTAAYRVLMMDSMKKPAAYVLPLMTGYKTEDGEIVI